MSAEGSQLVGRRYRLIAPLGSGAMGTVWRSYDELLGREVAVKEVVIPDQLSAEEHATLQARTMREARTAAQLDDPTVVRVYDVVDDGTKSWIVMELVSGPSLAEAIREQGPLPAAYVATVGLAVLRALRAAHAAQILHRDVKPSNVLLADDGRIVLTDFGVATVEGDPTLTTSGMLIGSPSYMAPERARGMRPGPESDLWSLGATLYAAVEGRTPFDREGALPTITAAITEPHPSPRNASEPLRAAIDGLLVKEPERRLDAAGAERLLREAASDPVAAPVPATAAAPATSPATTPTASSPRRHRRRWGVLLGAGLGASAVAIGAVLGVLTLTDDDDPQAGEPGASSTTDPAETPSPPADEEPSDVASTAPAAEPTNEEPTSPPPEEPSPTAPAAVPAGFRLHEDDTGFSVAVPETWEVVREGRLVDFEDPGSSRYLRIDQTDEPRDDPLADWLEQEPVVADRLENYQRIRIESVDYRGWLTADWEFTFGTDGHVLNRNLVTGPMAYALYWSVPEPMWAESLPLFEVIAATFQPAGG